MDRGIRRPMGPARSRTAQLIDTVRGWHGRPVVVVGDVLLDQWRFADPQRLCREAAAPVVRVRRQEDAAGGAGNAAVNLAALGARPLLLGAVGDDDAGARVRACLSRAGVRDGVVTAPGRATPRRSRLVAADQILLCEQDGVRHGRLPAPVTRALLEGLRATISRPADAAPVLMICDYATGTLDDSVREWLIAHRAAFPVVGLDAHDLSRWAGLAPTVVTPSYAEAMALLGTASPAEAGEQARDEAAAEAGDRVAVALRRAPEVARRTGAHVTAMTLDVDGAVITGAGAGCYRTRTRPAPACHTVGAGDVFFAALTLALAGGADPPLAADLAQTAAAVTLGGTGTCVCAASDLLAALGQDPRHARSAGAVEAPALGALVRHHRDRGARVVFTNGCFDVLHRGHVGYLAQARELGDLLIVAVNSDAGVRRLKGPERPVNPVEDRVAVLAALSCVDYVVVFEEDAPSRLIEEIRPDVYVKGGDYRPELVPEAPLVRRLGGEVRTLEFVPDRSTSAIIDRIRSGSTRLPTPG